MEGKQCNELAWLGLAMSSAARAPNCYTGGASLKAESWPGLDWTLK